MADERLYTDDEMAEILSRAVQPVSSSGVPARRASGVSLAEMEAIASEAGIDPARVRAAARSLGTAGQSREWSLMGGPRGTHVLNRVAEGSIPSDRFGEAIGMIRSTYRGRGKAEVVGDWLEWTSEAGQLHLTVRSEGEDTKIQLVANGGLYGLAAYGPLSLATLIALVSLGDAGSLTVGLAAGIVGGAYAIGRGIWEYAGRAVGRRFRRDFDALATEMTRLAEPVDPADPEPEE